MCCDHIAIQLTHPFGSEYNFDHPSTPNSPTLTHSTKADNNHDDGDGNDGVVFEAEAHDRTTLDLPAVQVDLLSSVCAAAEEAGTRVVVVLMNGGPISAYSAATGACVHALVEAWYPGQAGGSALADLLFGVASPSGRLPVTVPVGDAQLADNYYDLSLTAGPHGRTYVRPLSCR